MAALNAAYGVLSDPTQRARYDRGLSGATTTRPTSQGGVRADPTWSVRTVPGPLPPARIPWRLMAIMASVGIGVVLLGAAVIDQGPVERPVGLLRPGSCVEINPTGDVSGAPCTGVDDLIVERLVDFDGVCPMGTTGYRDRQGLGQACVRS
jgi:hypothetical protein